MKHVSASRRPRRNLPAVLLLLFNVLSVLFLIGTCSLLFVWPQREVFFHLDEQTTRMLILNLASLVLLMAWRSGNLAGSWRWFTLVSSFAILTESCLISLYR